MKGAAFLAFVLAGLLFAGSSSAATSGTLRATLAGASEVPGPGDPDGSGSATLRLDAAAGEVCYDLAVSDMTLPAAAAHVHLGASGVAGDILVPLAPPDAAGKASGCATGVAGATVQAILDDPASFYVNVHTSDFPAGALRGQLRRAPLTFTLVERETRGDEFGFVDNPPRQRDEEERPTLGDQFLFTGGLFTQARGGRRAGTLSVACTIVERRPARFHCTGTVKLARGSLSITALITGDQDRIFAAITGGTGIYEGANGTLVSTQRQDVSYDRFTIFLP